MAYEWRKGDLEWDRPKPIPPILNKSMNPDIKIPKEEIEVV